jgi:signal recognition particle GTPase
VNPGVLLESVMPKPQPWTIGDTRQHLVWCAHPPLFFRVLTWIMSWFMGKESREILRSVPEVRHMFVRQIGVIDSMTPEERARPELISYDREYRIAQGSGVEPGEVQQVLQMHQSLRQWHRERQQERSKR